MTNKCKINKKNDNHSQQHSWTSSWSWPEYWTIFGKVFYVITQQNFFDSLFCTWWKRKEKKRKDASAVYSFMEIMALENFIQSIVGGWGFGCFLFGHNRSTEKWCMWNLTSSIWLKEMKHQMNFFPFGSYKMNWNCCTLNVWTVNDNTTRFGCCYDGCIYLSLAWMTKDKNVIFGLFSLHWNGFIVRFYTINRSLHKNIHTHSWMINGLNPPDLWYNPICFVLCLAWYQERSILAKSIP